MLLSMSLFISCDNELDPFTPGSLTEEIAITKSSDLNRLLNTGMSFMTNRTEYVFSSIFTDEAALGFNNGGQGRNLEYVFLMQQTDPNATTIWKSNYYALARLNRAITFSPSIVPVNAADTQIINRIKAEALILRAICHLKIVSYYSPDPKNNDALAGVLANRIISTAETPVRATNGAFYASIHADLDEAIAIYATNTAPAYTAKTIKPSLTLAKAMKARAFALKGDYPNALSLANQVIATPGLTLASTQIEYSAVFHTHNEVAGKEVIFRLKRTAAQNTQGGNLHNGWCSVTNRRNGSPFYEVSRALYNKYTNGGTILPAAVTDFRFQTSIFFSTSATTSSLIDPGYATATDVRNSDVIVLQKHGGQAATTATNGFNPDFMVSRLSEMYFIKAEAEVAAGNLAAAGTTLKVILDARFPVAQTAPVFASAQAAWKGILDERRKELSFEGFRYIDLKRLGALAGATLDRDPSDYASSSWALPGANPSNLPITSYKYALPIPQDELNANGVIQQNPGY